LEVTVAKNVLRAWSYARLGSVPDLAQRCAAIIYYAENDAYILPEHEEVSEIRAALAEAEAELERGEGITIEQARKQLGLR
jgi:hypothetical protein